MTDPDLAEPAASTGPAAGESFGQYLCRERELRSMSLQQISEQTRIGISQLRALEQDDPSRLPARVFVLGYIRAYAKAIGLDPDEAVLRFEEKSQIGSPPAEESKSRRSRRGLLLAVLGVLAAAGAIASLLLWRR